MSLSRAGVMSSDEEQVCLMIKQVQVKAISGGRYGPFSNTLWDLAYNIIIEENRKILMNTHYRIWIKAQ